jgi:hypothetical protein
VSSKGVKKKLAAVNREKDGLTGSMNMKNLIIFKFAELFYEKVPLMRDVNKVQLQYNL